MKKILAVLSTKTFWFNSITVGLGAVTYFNDKILTDLGIPEQNQKQILAALGITTFVGNLILRTWFINGPIVIRENETN